MLSGLLALLAPLLLLTLLFLFFLALFLLLDGLLLCLRISLFLSLLIELLLRFTLRLLFWWRWLFLLEGHSQVVKEPRDELPSWELLSFNNLLKFMLGETDDTARLRVIGDV